MGTEILFGACDGSSVCGTMRWSSYIYFMDKIPLSPPSSPVKSPTMAATDFEVREITTKDEFARLNDVLWTSNFHPYELSLPFDNICNKPPD
jgi:hypothetical protein